MKPRYTLRPTGRRPYGHRCTYQVELAYYHKGWVYRTDEGEWLLTCTSRRGTYPTLADAVGALRQESDEMWDTQ